MIQRAFLPLRPLRFEILAMAAASLLLTGLTLFVCMQLATIGDVRACMNQNLPTPGSTCAATINRFWEIHNGLALRVLQGLSILPFVVGAVICVPVVGRELEDGTAPLSWALAGSRTRWLAVRLIRLGVLILLILLPAVIASELLEARLDPYLDPGASFVDWGYRGIPLLAYGLAAGAIGLVAGATLGRTLPALILAGAVCLVLKTEAHPLLTQLMPAQISTQEMVVSKVSNPDLVIRFESVDAQGNPVDDPNSPFFVKYVIPGRQYFEMEMLECGLLLAFAAAGAGAGLAAVKYRRPY